MKKFILSFILLVLFIPFYVNAKTCDTDKILISSIVVEEKTSGVEELDAATVDGKNISLNLSMLEVGDNIKYKMVIENNSDEDYELNKNSFKTNSDYIDYTLELEDESAVVKSNSSKPVYLSVEYKDEVQNDKFESGAYSDNKTLALDFSADNTTNMFNILKNPNTGVKSYLLIFIVLLLISGTIYMILKKKKYVKFMIFILGSLLIIPFSVYAICKSEFVINSNIKIIEPEKISINGNIYWDDQNDRDNIRPSSVKVNLLANNNIIKSIEVTDNNNWNYTFDNLLKYNNGEEITYTVTEDDITDYSIIINNYIITNKHEINNYIEPVQVASNNTITVGDEYQINSEHFYVISSNSDKTLLLSKLNLKVGSYYLYVNNTPTDDEYTCYSYSETYLQGYKGCSVYDNNTYCYGTVPYSGEGLSGSGNSGIVCTRAQGIFTNDKYYRSSSYLDRYKSKLIEFNAPETINVRLITYDEMSSLGCTTSSCANAPTWLKSTNFWIDGAYTFDIQINRIDARYNSRNFGSLFGIRPVVEVPTSDLS